MVRCVVLVRFCPTPCALEIEYDGRGFVSTQATARAGSQREFRGSPRFELVRKVGAGGFGVVYEAIDRDLGGRVALKALQRITPDSLIALKQEFRSLADVSHPNLVALYELAEH